MRRQILISLALVTLGACAAKTEPQSGNAPGDLPKQAENIPADVFDVDTRVAEDGQTLELVIRAKKGFKLNDEYPHAFRPGDEAGLTFANARYELWAPSDKEPCAERPAETCELHAKIPFDRAGNGEGVVKGVASFSVCSADICLIERVDVAARLAARSG